MHTIKTAKMNFPGVKLNDSLIHKARGYFSQRFKEYDTLHNHKNGDKLFYRYPAVQFKMTDSLSLIAFKQDGINVLEHIFLKTDSIDIEGTIIDIHEKHIEVSDQEFGETGETYNYRFTSPWLALNQENFKRFKNYYEYPDKQRNILKSIMINNIIAFCKFSGYTVREKLVPDIHVKTVAANLKGNAHIAFTGSFQVNFLLPDLLGLGKSSSRGYGSIQRIR
ncbi:MAG: CRISPR-associated endonuclease Cas6 [bacterium]|nr:CRISPR-associated endonuclease Cas6 [bacterium]